jgi:tetratricopeptide (TPR) repeat protein
MTARRRSNSELPNAPLELLHPLLLPGAEIPGAEVLREIGGGDGITLLELLRAVLAWSAHPQNAPEFESASLARAEYELLSRGNDPFASPAGLLAGYMAEPASATPREVAWACVCISDWASERGARATALQFAQAAAHAWPRHPRYAWLVARVLRGQGRMRESDAWFRRAHRIAVWTDDWEAQALTLNSLGNLYLAVGRFPSAKKLNLRARSVARRHSLTRLEGEVTHDLFITSAEMNAFEDAEAYASQAFALYGRSHPRLPMLMHDVAQFWVEQRHYARALPVLTALLRKFVEPAERIRVLAATVHAAGAMRLMETFERCWLDYWEVTNLVKSPPVLASTLYEVGIGAANVEQWDRAATTLELARDYARQARSHDVAERVEVAISLTRAKQVINEPAVRPSGSRGDVLAQDFVASLKGKQKRLSPAKA